MAKIKVTKTRATSRETSSTIEFLDDIQASERTKNKIKNDVADFLIDSTLTEISKSRSPVRGERFAPLSPEYKKKKVSEGGSGRADLELSGDMLDEFKRGRGPKNGITYGIFGDDAPKADGHNNLSGKSKLPKRRFLPGKGQKYTKDIRDGILEIINDHLVAAKKPGKNRLRKVDSRSSLNNLIKELYPSLSVNQAKQAILRDDELTSLFSEFDLLEFLSDG